MYKYLDKVNSPQDIKNMTVDELDLLAKDIRKFLVRSVSQTGGHLASNLGVVELTLALHRYLTVLKIKLYGMLAINLMYIKLLQVEKITSKILDNLME